MTPAEPRVRLIDLPTESGRTTATLLASLAARLAALHVTSGAMAVGSLVAGIAALGRDVSRTSDGARLRRAIEAGRAGTNGPAVWNALRIGDWAGALPASPIIDQLRNDMGLLLAGDLDETLALLPIPGYMAGTSADTGDAPVTFLDCVMGFWALGSQLADAVEHLAAPTLATPNDVDVVPTETTGAALLR